MQRYTFTWQLQLPGWHENVLSNAYSFALEKSPLLQRNKDDAKVKLQHDREVE